MAIQNTPTHYGGVAKTFHWLTALLVLTLIPTGWYAHQLPYDTAEQLAQKAWLFSLHKTLGVSVFFVALLRILWALSQPKPGVLNGDNKLESFAAELVHWLLYAALVIVPLSGWIGHAAASGFAPIWWPFGQGLPLVPKSLAVEKTASTVHIVATKVIIVCVLAHIAGALKHRLIDRDATLARMLPGTPDLPVPPLMPHSRAPAGVAALIWALVVGGGGAVGLAGVQSGDVAELRVAEVASDWQVEDGAITITVNQFGSDVAGSFASWNAAITFDPEAPGQKAGTVEARISIPSLTLGSVTQQAMGADFFDADNHPEAVFAADILKATDGYEAQGTLTIKGAAVPLSMPFSLSITEGVAQMRADLSLDRRSFGIGDNMGDEASLGFGVGVNITLTARQAAQ